LNANVGDTNVSRETVIIGGTFETDSVLANVEFVQVEAVVDRGTLSLLADAGVTDSIGAVGVVLALRADVEVCVTNRSRQAEALFAVTAID